MRQKWCLCVHDEVCSREEVEEEEEEVVVIVIVVVVVGVVVMIVVVTMLIYMEDAIHARDAAVRVWRRGKGG